MAMANQLTYFKEVVAVYSEKPTNTMWIKMQFLNAKAVCIHIAGTLR
jgi:hypothetical protein